MSLDAVQRRVDAQPRRRAADLVRPVEPQPLAGGITNANFTGRGRGRRYVVRIGDDIPVHSVVRANELAASRAAHAAGLRPGVVHAEPGVLVLDFIEGRTFTPEDVRNPANLDRLVDWCAAATARSRSICAARRRSSGCSRSCATTPHTLREGNSRHAPHAARSSRSPARLEAAVGPVDIVFGHNDLLAANIIDDGKRLWLVDWEYAGFNSPLFDLGGLASNSELPPAQARAGCSSLFRQAGRRRACAAAPPR